MTLNKKLTNDYNLSVRAVIDAALFNVLIFISVSPVLIKLFGC
jgi:hypothetical protein